ncbi:hypothetical protein Dsin_020964 [Dipteronia sinensis]|uniref:Uncharacterized protein n=1 Tax=Dipteronia sinensis TaxID=43782 RepID=A0AAE0ABD2_9ROSI|nr:hypothetical protein Dsin_020964 [Dipteronia sinensis]
MCAAKNGQEKTVLPLTSARLLIRASLQVAWPNRTRGELARSPGAWRAWFPWWTSKELEASETTTWKVENGSIMTGGRCAIDLGEETLEKWPKNMLDQVGSESGRNGSGSGHTDPIGLLAGEDEADVRQVS